MQEIFSYILKVCVATSKSIGLRSIYIFNKFVNEGRLSLWLWYHTVYHFLSLDSRINGREILPMSKKMNVS